MVEKKDANRENTGTRKVINQHGSLYISLPKKFAENHRIKAGDFVSVVWGSFLRVIPAGKEDG
jgi:hypothetical protein